MISDNNNENLGAQAKKPKSKSRHLQRQASLDVASDHDIATVSSSIVMQSDNNSSSTSVACSLKRAMTLPVRDEPSRPTHLPCNLLAGGPGYIPLRSPMRSTSSAKVSNSETSETLLDIPLLISTAEKMATSEAVDNKPLQPVIWSQTTTIFFIVMFCLRNFLF